MHDTIGCSAVHVNQWNVIWSLLVDEEQQSIQRIGIV